MTETRRPTIVERLRAAATTGRSGATVMHTDDGPTRLDAAELYDRASVRAAILASRGAGLGTPVGIVGPNAADWFAWAFATWMVGGTVVALPVPFRVRDREALRHQLASLVRGFDCGLVAVHERYEPLLPDGLAVPWSSATTARDPLPASAMPAPDPDGLAVVWTTSGTTAVPKGVSRTHRANDVMSLTAMMKPDGFEHARFLTYSPCAHGGGFLGIYAPLHPWLEMHMLSPERFARDPGLLFRMVGDHGISTMSVTSSGVSAALRAIERKPQGVDLSGLVWMTLSFEMIDPDVLERLLEIGGRHGLRPEAVGTYYGLAEGGWTKTPNGQGITVDEVDLDRLAGEGVAAPPRPGHPSKRIVSCGVPTGQELRIAGEGGPLPERRVGQIQFRSPYLMRGYVGATGDDPIDDEGWMHTGDTGYLAGGELYVTGRSKEVLVQQGRKYHPEDIEWAAARAAGVDRSACVAFANAGAPEGDVTVLVEIEADAAAAADLETSVRAGVMNAVGVTVRTVVAVSPGTLPKATTGKAQRLAAREWFSAESAGAPPARR